MIFVPSGLNHQLGLSSSSPVAGLYTSTTANPTFGFPFKLNSVANIVGSSFAAGDKSYPFFYDWQVEVTSQACNNGQRKPVIAYTVPAPAVVMSGLQPAYNHAAFGVQLIGTPAGGTFSGNGVVNGYFYPRVAGLGSHIITYTYSNGFCTSQTAKETRVVLDETLLDNGFSVQLLDHPGSHPVLWVVSNDNSTIEIALLTNTGQTLMTMQKPCTPEATLLILTWKSIPKQFTCSR